jgi:hypothetical protein
MKPPGMVFCWKCWLEFVGVAVCGLKTTKIAPSKERCSGLFSLSGLEIPNDAHLKFDTHR